MFWHWYGKLLAKASEPVMPTFKFDPELEVINRRISQIVPEACLELFYQWIINLDNFQHLPDARCELYYQWKPCTTFHAFPKLPIEVRFRIFRYIDLQGRKLVARVEGSYSRTLQSRAPAPVALRINQESRNETLRYYEKPYDCKPDNRQVERVFHRSYFNPDVDIVSIADTCALGILCDEIQTFASSRHNKGVVTGEAFYTIQHLEVTRCNWHEAAIMGWQKLYRDWDMSFWHPHLGRHLPLHGDRHFTFFGLFPSLETLTIIAGGAGLRTASQAFSCLWALTWFFSELRDKHGYKVPRINIKMQCHEWNSRECEICDWQKVEEGIFPFPLQRGT